MPDKVTLTPVTNIDNTLIAAINNNNAAITTAMDNTLSRNGQVPNQMSGALDMNSNPIINVPFASLPNEPVVLAQLANLGSSLPVGFPTLVGDVTGVVNNSTGQVPTTIATVNSNVGTFGGTQVPSITVNAKGQVTAASQSTLSGANLAASSVANAELATMANNTVKGNVSGGTANPSDLTTTQLTTLVNNFTSALSGAAPASGGGVTNFLRADGSWTAPSGGTGTPTVQVFTSGTTYTPTGGTVYIRVRMVGGGGGGGAAATNAGSAGGDTIFGGWHAKGGGGGPAGNTGTVPGGAGGTGGASGTGTQILRSPGIPGGGIASGASNFSSGFGGWTSYYTTDAQGIAAAGPGSNAPIANSGCAGSGGFSSTTNAGGGGGGGEWLEFFMTSAQIGASQSITVGAAGSGGAAGTQAGGNGAAGQIWVEEYPF